MNQIGAAIAALVGPLVYEHFGPAVVFSGVAVLMLVLYVFGARLSVRPQEKSGPDVRVRLSS